MAAERRQDGRRQTEREVKKRKQWENVFCCFFVFVGGASAQREELACVLKIGFPISQPLIFAIMLS